LLVADIKVGKTSTIAMDDLMKVVTRQLVSATWPVFGNLAGLGDNSSHTSHNYIA
jgi:hypothetical protein